VAAKGALKPRFAQIRTVIGPSVGLDDVVW
jgi:hypothetical protein